jgi:DNA-binding transcriptional MerR regulator
MKPMASLLIGDLAGRVGVGAPTIRYYESLGLLKRPSRSDAGYRRYSDSAVAELRFIRKARGLGFTLEEVAEILRLTRAGKAPCDRVLALSGVCQIIATSDLQHDPLLAADAPARRPRRRLTQQKSRERAAL